MDSINYFLIFLLPLIIILIQKQRYKNWFIQLYLKLKYRKENHLMVEAAKNFIDKECLIYLLNGEVSGIIREVTDNSLLVENKTTRQLLNLNFVIRIREYPKGKTGKKNFSF